MKSPKKEELRKLIKQYKTDKRIGQALNGVPANLVAYWRRKKGLDKVSFPKYSLEEIKALWEKWGDDQKAGEELGITKAAFYKWRRKYGIKEKPKFLKLEQLELNFAILSSSSQPGNQTIAQKILAKKADKKEALVGEIVNVEPDLAMSHDNAGLVIKQFKEIGVEKVWNPDKIVIPLDHRAPAESEKTATAHRSIRIFVKEQGIKKFYDIKEGICHQIVVEKAHILPGQLGVGTDSHTTSWGCLSAISTGIGATEMAAVWATGKIWLRVPETLKITISGKLPLGVYAKDVILFLAKELTVEGATYKSIEYYGETIRNMSISERFTMCNLSMEMGAKFATVPLDEVTQKYLSKRNSTPYQPIWADKDAVYEKEFNYHIDKLEPQIAFPHNVDNVKPISEVRGIKIDQVVLGSCTNGRLDDLEIAARILAGRKVHPDVRMLILPGSKEIYLQAMKKGFLKIFLEADAVILNPGCGPCLGAHQGILAKGERALTTTNRNFKGRMGSPESEVYLASPAVASATAIKGEISDPREFLK
jgi:3-isopropylmalate/(R)-2-methylmalate dehydratase large subunit